MKDLVICEHASECSGEYCDHKEPHDLQGKCSWGCGLMGGITKCLPIKPKMNINLPEEIFEI